MKSFNRQLEKEEIQTLIKGLYRKPSFQKSIDNISNKYNIKLSRYKVEIAQILNFQAQKNMKVLVLSYCEGTIEMMYAIQDQKEIVTFTSIPTLEILAS
ncbi:hypothetical protein ACFVWC_30095 [Bacillus mycoides]|uniref:hypothetical protein n=1 Tax=Bacillus mycoides TaxID=1405 RepID=UPI0036ECCD69